MCVLHSMMSRANFREHIGTVPKRCYYRPVNDSLLLTKYMSFTTSVIMRIWWRKRWLKWWHRVLGKDVDYDVEVSSTFIVTEVIYDNLWFRMGRCHAFLKWWNALGACGALNDSHLKRLVSLLNIVFIIATENDLLNQEIYISRSSNTKINISMWIQ